MTDPRHLESYRPINGHTMSAGDSSDLDWKVILSTFGLIFLAELGDKTQLTTMTLSAQSDAPWAVFIGAAAALALSAGLGVVFGDAITRGLPRVLFGAEAKYAVGR